MTDTDRTTQAYERLRELIVHGRLAPGSRLIETEVAERLGLSRTPVRGAFQRLTQEGYITEPGGGRQSRPFVSPLTQDDARELFYIVGEIEGLAAWRAAKRPAGRAGLAGRLRDINRQLLEEAGGATPSREKIFQLDTGFHRTYVEGGAGPRLLALHDSIKPQAERYTRLYIEALVDKLTVSVEEHEAIVDAIEDGDPDLAQKRVQTNWRNAAERLSRVIAKAGELGELVGTETADVLVVGAGIVGASCALELTRAGLSVGVVEREPSPAMGSTGRSAAGVRVQFTTAANVGLSLYSLPVFRDFEALYGTPSGYRDLGYLLLVPEDRWAQHLEAVDLQRRMGAPVDVLTPHEAQELTPLDPAGLGGATFGSWDGVVDPHLVTAAWVARGREEGVRFRMGWDVRAVERKGGVWVVRSGDGRVVESAWVVNAAGAWSADVAALAGLALPVRPKRVQIFLSAPLAPRVQRPMTIDLATGVYLRSEGDRILFGLDDLGQGFGYSEGIDPAWLEHVLVTGAGRFPWWEDMGVDWKGSWWGYYAVTPDHSPIIAAHPDADGWVDACGFSGHGIMHSPATGRAVAELVAKGAATTVDVSAFTHGRFASAGSRPAAEANVF